MDAATPFVAHMSAPNQKKKRERNKEGSSLCDISWTGPLNRSVNESRNLEKPLNSPSGALCVCLHSVYLHEDTVFARSVLSVLLRQC